MKPARHLIAAFLATVCAAALGQGGASSVGSAASMQTETPRGQTVTRQADGRWLVIGGETPDSTARVLIYDPSSGRTKTVPGLAQGRAWHTATVLPDGRVLVVGGQGPNGQLASAVELFDPATDSFLQLSAPAAAVRSGHTATLLTDGRLLMTGGRDANGVARADAELWTVDLAGAIPIAVRPTASPLRSARAYHRATLQGDGSVLVEPAEAQARRTPADVFRPADGTFSVEAGTQPPVDVVAIAESQPLDGAIDVEQDTRIVIRFTAPISFDAAQPNAIELVGANGAVPTRTVPAEGGRLLFIWPMTPLDPGSDYALKIAAIPNERHAPVEITFTTRHPPGRKPAPPESEAWIPDPGSLGNGWQTGRPDSPWRRLPPLQAPAGVTAVAGQVLRLDGLPLREVTLVVGPRSVRTDRTGRFLLLLADVQTRRVEMLIDGRTANRPRRTYGLFEVGVRITAGSTTVLPYTVWMPLIDTAHAVRIPSPTTSEVVITNPAIPGLEVHLPAGTVIRDHEGKIVRELSITPVPLDRPPFSLPPIEVPVYFTVQPGGAYIHTYGAEKGAWVVYPSNPGKYAGKRVPFFHYDAGGKDWYVYGLGTVTPDATQVVPDRTTRLYEFTAAMIDTGQGPPPDFEPPGDCCGNDADPVNLPTGLFELDHTDLYLPDIMPLALTRTYRTRDLDIRPFGLGSTHPYAMFLWWTSSYQEVDLWLPDLGRIHYVRTSPGNQQVDAVLEHIETETTSATPTLFYKSKITWDTTGNSGWDLQLKNGTVYRFDQNGPLQSIRDRSNNTIRFTWSNPMLGPQDLLQVTSSHGRWIRFTYDALKRIVEAKDNVGRTVGYTYDVVGRLWKVHDPMNQVTEYTYDNMHRLLTVKNRGGVVSVRNEYHTEPGPSEGWIKKQTLANGGTYQFTYNIVNGKSTQTDVTGPDGQVRRTTFNGDGYTLTDTRGLGTAGERTSTAARQPGAHFITSTTDQNGHQTAVVYDARGNVASVTRLAGTSAALTTTYTHEPIFDQPLTVTDPLNRTTTFAYDALNRLAGITDSLQHETTFTYNSKGQRTSETDALDRTATYAYDGPELKTITEPGGRVTTQFHDSLGRLVAVTDPMGRTVRRTYDLNSRVLSVTDPLGNQTVSTYLPDGSLQSVTNAGQQTTSYTYDEMGRFTSRNDPLNRTDTHAYDIGGNLIQSTDRMGQVTSRAYDPVGRLDTVTYADSSSVTYTYDDQGRITQVIDSVAGTIGRVYDDLDRVTSETTPQGSVSYTYDAASRRETMSATGQPTVTYTYDDGDRLTGISKGGSNVALTYDDANRRTSLTLPNGVVTEYAYDDADQITGLTYRQGGTVLGTLTYTYDLAGRRTSMGGTWARTGLPQAVSSASYDAANQLIAWGTSARQYDETGSLVSDGLSSYTWNSRGRLTAVSGATSASFAYDAAGRRVAVTSSGSTSQYLYDGANLVSESRAGTTVGFLTGTGMDEWLARTDASGTVSLLADGLGSTVGVVDPTGAVVGQATYEAFGATETYGVTDAQGRFTGREQDETGLYSYRARYYDPKIGRFLSEDPAGTDRSGNLYAYVDNDPTNSVDPTGLTKVDVCCRPLRRKILGMRLLKFMNHCYIQITYDDGTANTYGILGDEGSTRNQIPRFNDGRNALDQGGSCKPVQGGECEIQRLIEGLNNAVNSASCPACGSDYDAFRPTDLVNFVDGYNSNTFIYNMISGAGMTPPSMSRSPGYHRAPGAWYP